MSVADLPKLDDVTHVMIQLGPGWSSLSEAELTTLEELAAGATVLEIGAQFGGSTLAMARTAERVVSVDWHKGDPNAGQFETLHAYLSAVRLRDNITPIIGRFEHVLPLLRPDAFDLVFVDGAHDFDSVVHDLQWALRLVKPNGTICGDDYGRFDVAQAWLQVFRNEPARVVEALAIQDDC